MYVFGMMALLGLAVLAIVNIGDRYLSLASEVWASEVWAFLPVALGVGAAWLINLNLFSLWAIPARDSAIAVTLTGLVIAGAAYFWRAVLGFLGGLTRKLSDQAKIIEGSEHLRRVA